MGQEDLRASEGGQSGERERERESERNNGDFDSSMCSGHDLCTKYVSVFHKDIRHKGKTNTLIPYFSLLLGLTLEICPLQSLLPTGR